jgi:MFS family permease
VPGWEFWAPFLLVVMRFCQGLGLGGEWSGAVLLATENAPEGKRAVYGTFPQLGAPIGFIAANVLFLVLSLSMPAEQFALWGWRIPFLLSAVLVIVGLYVRFTLVETPAFQKVVDTGEVAKLPLARVFKTSWREILLGTFIMLATYVLFYLMTAFTLTYGTAAATAEAGRAAAEKAGKTFDPSTFVPGLGHTRNDFLIMLIIGVVFFGIFTLVAGPLADRFGRRATLIWVTLGIIGFGLLFVPLFSGGVVGTMALLIVGFTLMGLAFGPMGAKLPELFPTNVRYTGSAIAYNLASVLGAAVAPTIAVWLWALGNGSTVWVGAYLSAAGVITLIALLLSKETKDVDYAGKVS